MHLNFWFKIEGKKKTQNKCLLDPFWWCGQRRQEGTELLDTQGRCYVVLKLTPLGISHPVQLFNCLLQNSVVS